MANYKTPGVFVEEIPKFPPSVAQVETAIPAFVGYTQKADNLVPGDLHLKPRRIGSMVEYELFYGFGASPVVTKVNIDDTNIFRSAVVKSTYFLYDSLRLFYSNGGGDCYIVSVGLYGTGPTPVIDKGALNKGIDELMKEDDPTILLFPDAVALPHADLKDVQQYALKHCADEERRDRVTILDLKEDDPKGEKFRQNIGINFLSYGMAYTPWLKVSLPKNVRYKDIKGTIFRSGSATPLKGLTADAAIQSIIDNLDNANTDLDKINAKIATASAPSGSLRDKFNTLLAAYNTSKDIADFQAMVKFLNDIGKMIDDLVRAASTDILTSSTLLGAVKLTVTSTFSPLFAHIIGLDKEAVADITGPPAYASQVAAGTFSADTWDAGMAATPATSVIEGTGNEEKMDNAIADLQSAFDSVNSSILSLVLGAAESSTKTLDDALELSMPVYKNLLKGVRESMSAMPPSGAIAGVYAMVDRTRGVWKAPANVSLAHVLEPTVTFTRSELDKLNIDATAGKSINAIRTFFGKGTLVYGARTLAGNDNEWRYIPVRRLFVMVEESVKKATEQFVFEPNDANTWVKVQAMIENFLHFIWRQGALQGAKPEHAFYVAVGLGKTMNPVDILEGRMIIEIGMAAVRPAEFIILRFSHKLAES
jgi:phage tail sheath protein FI